MRAIFGADRLDGGTVQKNGKNLAIRKPSDAIAAGIAYLPEDRKEQGLVLALSGHENLSLTSLARGSGFGLVSWPPLCRAAESVAQRLHFRGDLRAPVRTSSGGNQQKIVIGKWAFVAGRGADL